MNKTQNDLVILQRELRGVETHYCTWLALDNKSDNRKYECDKCRKSVIYKTGSACDVCGYLDEQHGPCEIPSPLTNPDGSLSTPADVAEMIRVYVAGKLLFSQRRAYHRAMQSQQENSQWHEQVYADWLVLHATPTDKIKAFIKAVGSE